MFNKKISPTFCSSPWTTLYINSMGDFFNCCLNESFYNEKILDCTGRPYNATHAPELSEIWNSQQIKSMRQEMLSGKWPKVCESCKKQEASNLPSFRQALNYEWRHELFKFTKKTNRDGFFPPNLKKLDIKPGNDCNLSCNMCSPQFSKKTRSDLLHLYSDKPTITYDHYIKNHWYLKYHW